jgi:hypothetical protein
VDYKFEASLDKSSGETLSQKQEINKLKMPGHSSSGTEIALGPTPGLQRKKKSNSGKGSTL